MHAHGRRDACTWEARHQPEHAHLLRLADAVDAVHGLQVDLRVEVGVVEHDGVGGGERDPEAAGARRAEEDLLARARVERAHVERPLHAARRAVEAGAHVLALGAQPLEHVERRRVPREDDDAVAAAEPPPQQPVDDVELTARLDEALAVGGARVL